ncbi:hypothetical protein HGRIS_006632 [Hohenbuehelia grisea]|uniref:Man(5)GlcNAc(2)-PP-dolichol translocation protein RFT1 n=1 Tax=Hohenbuehelia grisea TaxID=104357 RepID=A0ABR3JA39_9AGAR
MPFLSREGVRHALLRTPKGSPSVDNAPRTRISAITSTNIASSNLALVPLLLGLPLTVVAAVGYAAYASGEVQLQPGFRATVAVYALAALLELACEPMHNHSVTELKTSVRVRAEGLGVGAKSLMTFSASFMTPGCPPNLLAPSLYLPLLEGRWHIASCSLSRTCIITETRYQVSVWPSYEMCLYLQSRFPVEDLPKPTSISTC